MTINEFMSRFDIENCHLVISWIENDWIPGVTVDKNGNYIIPENALPPYTKARARDGKAVYISLLKGICARKQVLPSLYKMSSNEFGRYIEELRKAGLIIVDEVDGIHYYRPTPKGQEYISNNTGIRKLMKTFQPVTEGVVAGTVKGIMDFNDMH